MVIGRLIVTGREMLTAAVALADNRTAATINFFIQAPKVEEDEHPAASVLLFTV